MTRFGEISQLWPKVNNLRQIFEGLCGFWQNVELTLVKFNVQEQSFIVTNGQILKNNLAIWSHWTWASICSEEAQCFISNRFFGNTLLLQKKEIKLYTRRAFAVASQFRNHKSEVRIQSSTIFIAHCQSY